MWRCKKQFLSLIAIGSGSVSKLSSPDISDDDIGKIGLSQTVSMCALGVSVAALQDRFRDRMRLTVTVMLSLSVVSYVWLALICSEVRGTSNKVQTFLFSWSNQCRTTMSRNLSYIY